jgi:hypothetical protein
MDKNSIVLSKTITVLLKSINEKQKISNEML